MIHYTAVMSNYCHLYPKEPWKSPISLCPTQVTTFPFRRPSFLCLAEGHRGGSFDILTHWQHHCLVESPLTPRLSA